jgi:nucleolar GTP-binding protein
LKQKQKEIYGRISSVLKQIDNELMLLSKAQRIIRKFPEITDLPTIVIAGYPNVGKSSLLKCLSSAKPEIAQYPFTTKEIHVGHMEKKEKFIINRFQIIDTPGLLDRPIADKNEIERQAIAALDHLADLILFIIDSSETCGYSIEDQKNLLVNLEKIFLSSKIFVVENKIDFKETNSKNIKISCKTGEGIQELIDRIFSFFDLKEIN